MGEAFRPLNWDQARDLCKRGHDIGAHSVSHVILGREARAGRDVEIADSVRRVRSAVGECTGFAYPNGLPGDFDDRDIAVLRREGVPFATTTTPGTCTAPADLFRLPRTSIGLGHDDHIFTIEMSGHIDARRRRQQVGTWSV
jgi:peptidoglycan/xylan/chitin deacetylase (PgdA/CDA1 family)